MSFAKVYSAQNTFLRSTIIDLEVDIAEGLHAFNIVGLADKAVEEARDRISAALKNSGYSSPKSSNRKVVIALAPADVKKEGTLFDLGMAMAYLLASKEIQFDPHNKLFIGELSLDAELRPVPGVVSLVKEARDRGYHEVYVPTSNAHEAALIDGISVYAATKLLDVIDHLNTLEDKKPGRIKNKLMAVPPTAIKPKDPEYKIDFREIKGQESAKRGLEIAAAGGHNIAMYGPPGTGKTMLAKAFCHLLPELNFEEMLEVTSIHSIAGTAKGEIVCHPPFRSPHHTSSYVSLVGGGTFPKPGEVTLAHKGVLFLDEFPEFDRRVIDSLRQPLEERTVSVSRAKGSVHFPANFILVAAMNPCPCGNFGIRDKMCTCPRPVVERYQRKISGPIVDRVDMWLEVSKIDHEKLGSQENTSETTDAIKSRVLKARERQRNRLGKSRAKTNSEMSAKEIDEHVRFGDGARELLNSAATKLDLSARSYHRIVRLAQTIADLGLCDTVEEKHLLEALQYRPKKVAI